MSDLQARYAELQSAGRVPLYAYKEAAPVNPHKANTIKIALGLQPSGKFLYLDDLDSHKLGQNADAAKAAFERERPQIAGKVVWIPTPRGWHAFYETYKRLPTGRLYDSQGNHIGERLGDGSHTRDPGNIQTRTLTETECKLLIAFWPVEGGENSGEQWKERAKEGAGWVAGYSRIRLTKQQLKDFLLTHCGDAGRKRVQAFDTVGDRSEEAARLMLTLLYGAYHLPCGPGFNERCRTVMAYWMVAGSYGKADERDYNQEKDGCALLAAIIHGDTMKSGGKWQPPYWAANRTPDSTSVEKSPIGENAAPSRPAHRPVGDKEKHVAACLRILKNIVPDEHGQRTYSLAYLVEKMAAARCPAKTRTIQNYLMILRERGDIATGQINGNGRCYVLIAGIDFTRKRNANNCENRVETAPELPADRGANQIAPERVLTPQTTQTTSQCKEDHHNISALPSVAQAANSGESRATPSAYDLARTFFASAVDPLTGEVWERHTFARFKRFVEAHGPCHLATARRAFDVEQKRARFNRRDAADVKQARTLGLEALRRKSRSLATQAAAVTRALKTGVQPPTVLEYQIEYADGTTRTWKTKAPATLTENYAKLLLHRAGIYAAEEARRAPPDQLTMHEQWAQVGAEYEQVHQALKKHARPVARGAAAPVGAQGGGAPLSAPAGAPTPGTFDSLMAGIRAYHEGRAA